MAYQGMSDQSLDDYRRASTDPNVSPADQARFKEMVSREEQHRAAQGDANYVEGGPNQYGGSGQNFATLANEQLGRAMGARNRSGYAWDSQPYGQSMSQAQAARNQQLQGLGLLRDQMDLSKDSAASRAVLAGGARAQENQRSLATMAGGYLAQRGAANRAQLGNVQLGQQAAQQANIVRQQEAAQATADYGAAASALRSGDLSAVGQEQRAAQAEAQSRMRNDEQNAARERAAQGTRDAILKANQASQGGQAQSQTQWQQAQYDIEQGRNEQARQAMAAGFGAAGSAAVSGGGLVGSAARADASYDPSKDPYRTSDERLKSGARRESFSDMARATPGFAYNYRPESGEDPGKQEYGVMAQHLERTAPGRATVVDTPRGKMVDTGRLALAQQGVLHELESRISRMEKRR